MRAAKKVLLGLLAVGVVAGITTIPSGDAYADVQKVRSNVKGADGKDYWVENNIDSDIDSIDEAAEGSGNRPEYMVVWAGDENVASHPRQSVPGDLPRRESSISAAGRADDQGSGAGQHG